MRAIDTFRSDGASEYGCFVEYYTTVHSRLFLEIRFKHYVGYIQFWAVKFFSGPMMWHGLDFQVAPPEMTLEFIRNHREFDQIHDSIITDDYRLYYLDKPRFQVQIVATDVAQVDELPEDAFR